MAITAPVYNEPDCSAAACHIHPPGQKVLGTLDIGLSRAELDRSLGMLRIEMIIFTLMSLILTIGGVTLEENYWAVFGSGITILGVESYRIWTFCAEEISRKKEAIEFVTRTGRPPPQE